ncbi:hypothetical protein OA503_03145 [Prochlorococcus sp. AH-716-K03]|nr:hypothetical protein [Prochlorococcus sp. AH-716-K03]|tara:strand:- start:273 stop:989 length:717 start_codon:yes stop_codon:yes gene_type:complete
MNEFQEKGFSVIKDIFNQNEFSIIQNFVIDTLNKNLKKDKNLKNSFLKFNYEDLATYHEFIDDNNLNHENMVNPKNRYLFPPKKIKEILLKDELIEYVKKYSGYEKFSMCSDPGLGWLGYRLIRPNNNDGYPPSCKNWGSTKNVYSLWVPISGSTKYSNIRLLPGSFKKQYKKYLPKDSKFIQNEYRLEDKIDVKDFLRPKMNYRDALIFHPGCIHSEDSSDKKNSRLNLEYRFSPIK